MHRSHQQALVGRWLPLVRLAPRDQLLPLHLAGPRALADQFGLVDLRDQLPLWLQWHRLDQQDQSHQWHRLAQHRRLDQPDLSALLGLALQHFREPQAHLAIRLRRDLREGQRGQLVAQTRSSPHWCEASRETIP